MEEQQTDEMLSHKSVASSPIADVKEGSEERISNVKFEEAMAGSKYFKPFRMRFRRRGMDMCWELALGGQSVAAVLYHTERKQLLFVKQFRPGHFITTVRALPENEGKAFDDIRWESYPIQRGLTVELCAGGVDEPGKSPLYHIQKEILEECGYRLPESSIRPIHSYVKSVALAGSFQHMFYAELDESMRDPSGGGGLVAEGEIIQNVFMNIDETKAMIGRGSSPISLIMGFNWWMLNAQQGHLGAKENS
uniref:Nudix hydrolase domain-containing protein n=1 Tax=Globodera rostochiensis TaxID=31243 RepID=A0A914HJJ5_GLORO